MFVSALLEDEWNKGAEFRPKAAAALDGMVRSLGSLGRLVNPGLVETLEQARAARELFLREEVDLVLAMQLCFTQGVVPLKALLDFPRPLLVWNTQLLRTLPADAGWDTILVNSGVTGIPELTSALVRSGRRFFFVSGHFDDERCRREIREYAVAAHAARRLASAKVGVIGHPYKWMTDLMVDQLAATSRSPSAAPARSWTSTRWATTSWSSAPSTASPLRPDVAVLDGYHSFEGGPVPQCARGRRVEPRLALAGADFVAVDAVAATPKRSSRSRPIRPNHPMATER